VENPMRRIHPVKHGYDGPPPRGISGNPKIQNPGKKRTTMKEEKVLTKHPLGKSGKNIDKLKYDSVKKAILSALEQKALTHTELFERLNKNLKGKFTGNISWYGETVKLDLEARKIIHRNAEKPPKYRLKKK
jgi:Family of unknown function (DUF6958)